MQQQRKPKKLVLQVAVAALVAIVVGIGAVALVMMVIGNITTASQRTQLEAQEALKAKDAELARLRIEGQNKLPNIAIEKAKQVQSLTDIAAGEPITQALVTLVEVDGMPTLGGYSRIPDVLGKAAKVAIVSGEVLTSNKLIESGNLLQVKEGMRAMTVGMDSIASLDGALMPGSFVDILMTVSSAAEGSGNETLTKTLLQNVQVISVGNSLGGSSGSSASSGSGNGVTFLVTPNQAEMLVLASEKAKLRLTLRNFKDKSKPSLRGADLDRLVTGMLPSVSSRSKKTVTSSMTGTSTQSTYSPQSLPEPGPTKISTKGRYAMKIYTGSGSQTVVFE